MAVVVLSMPGAWAGNAEPPVNDDEVPGQILPPKPVDPAQQPSRPGDPAQAAAANKPDGIHDDLWRQITQARRPLAIYLGARGMLAKFQVAAQDEQGRWHVREFLTPVNHAVGEPVYVLEGKEKLFVNFATGYMFTAFESPVMQGAKVIRPDGVTISPREAAGDKLFLPNLGPPDPVVDEAIRHHREKLQAQMDLLCDKCRETDPDLRTAAMVLLSRYLPDSEATFAKLLKDDDITVRTHTLLVLCATGQDFGWGNLGLALKDRDPKMRAMALFLVTEFQRAEVESVVTQLCDDEDERLRTLAVYALVPQQGENKLFALRKALSDTAPMVVIAAIRALAQAGDPQAGEMIGKKIFDGNPEVRLTALQAIAAWPTADNVERVLAALGDREPAIRKAASVELRRISGLDSGLDVTQDPANADYVRQLQALSARWQKDKTAIKLSSANGRIGTCVLMRPTPGNIESLAFSPDGKTLALGGTFLIQTIDLAEGTEKNYDTGVIATQLQFDPAGTLLYYRVRGPQAQNLHRLDLTAARAGAAGGGAGEAHTVYSDPQPPPKTIASWREFALAADGKTLYGLHADGRRIVLFDTGTGKGEVIPYAPQAANYQHLALVTGTSTRAHPGDVLIYGSRDAWSWALTGKRVIRLSEKYWGLVAGTPAVLETAADLQDYALFPPVQRNAPGERLCLTGTEALLSRGPLVLQRVAVPNLLRPPQTLIDQLGLDKLMNMRFDSTFKELRLLVAQTGELLGEYPLAASVTTMTCSEDGKLVAFCSGGKVYVYRR
ncbi:MAG TPA: hypothetical protein VL860_08605 [Planctomycetota bacterium]|nr:hypothetical protein [Planctomycetota bacterium]